MAENDLYKIRCYLCGVIFAVEDGHAANLKRNHNDFYCPNGHPQRYVAPKETPEQTELKELRTKNAELEKKIAALQEDNNKLLMAKEILEGELELWRPREKEKAAAQ